MKFNKSIYRSSRPDVFCKKGVLTETVTKRCSLEKMLNLLHIFRTPFPKNTSGRLLLFLEI